MVVVGGSSEGGWKEQDFEMGLTLHCLSRSWGALVTGEFYGVESRDG